MNDKLMRLKEMLCQELEEYGSGQKLSTGSLDMIYKLSSTCKNLCKIIEADEGYSNAMDRSYRDGSSYDGGYSNRRRRDSMGRYSSEGYSRHSEDELHEVADQLRSMMSRLPKPTQRAVQEFIESVD